MAEDMNDAESNPSAQTLAVLEFLDTVDVETDEALQGWVVERVRAILLGETEGT